MQYRQIGRSGRYQNRDDVNDVISRRQYDNIRLAEQRGWNSSSERDKAAQSSEFKRWLQIAKDEGIPRAEFEAMYTAAKHEKWTGIGNKQNTGWSTEAKGEFAKMLVTLNQREPDADYCVGCTPRNRR